MPSDAPLILAFDTSAAHCAAALMSGDTLLATDKGDMARGQAEHLMPMLQTMLKTQQRDWTDIDLIAVGVGPGNFTGIRISVAAARGLALGLGIPTMAVSTFEVMRGPTSPHDKAPQLVSIKGSRDSLYLQLFGGGHPSGPPRQVDFSANVPDCIITPETLILGHRVGDLAQRLDGPIAPEQLVEREMADFGPTLARIALARWRQGETTPPPPAPLYVRAADAAPARDAPPVLLD
ncbi:tRNA (adenosine(37)-N6)-threonylcarbamoyltransferase complex dimerization subunit type 1 TsaB [Thalassococcus sp. S3]|uniref:tRNA (adenosine(37)-N6)-threonylcarbamoyltransferase complex dimerization subunit type 1 TsaB n=1 Tax=Thalassococcus sp. S3 TaxID=2017482 RepID=UPI0010242239|nr:tRNA (adenosine(37)-N6)-threonylcarbamoyltransferase complex dimerization subunit type 1 TsaB [Thalassococcus sp. S3]QBF33609.1 tRNA (adenosine(37)-N6)-threonylcarbamoyltransferase complex dimerization subunit type 1 TsaB [Thalassococcus sp. S3]